jgi:integrase
LKRAGITYVDASGRFADFHALRKTFGANLLKSNVAPRVAMELMRHSDMRLTAKIYTDAMQLPTAAAIQSLPSFGSK